jgi:predicted permease
VDYAQLLFPDFSLILIGYLVYRYTPLNRTVWAPLFNVAAIWPMARHAQQGCLLDPVQTTMLLAFSALPTASSCYVLAARMGYDGAYVAGLVTLSTLLGVASLSFALGVLRFI